MAKKAINKRCPFQRECGRKAHINTELKCDYYKNNACMGRVIDDQEDLRAMEQKANENKILYEQSADIADADDTEETYIEAEAAPAEKKLVYIPIDQLYPHPDNPRKDLGDLSELAESIKSKGVMQNLTVVPGHYMTHEEWQSLSKQYHENPSEELRAEMNRIQTKEKSADGYTIVIGHRRMAAAKLAGLSVLPCVITEMSEQEQVATMLLENIQRSDLTAYEQAKGFQMMMDLGDSVEGISEKTGFSRSTIRRRLEIAKLDDKKLKEASDRQITLGEIEKLSQIDDIKKRNECLADIGTNNFNQKLARILKEQNIKKKLPFVKEFIKKLGAVKINYSETYGGKYEGLKTHISFDDWDTETPLFKQSKGDTRKMYYYLDEDWGTVGFYAERPKAKPQKRPQEEIDKEKRIEKTRAKLKALASDMYKLRSSFVEELSVTNKNLAPMLEGAVIASLLHIITHVSTNSTPIYELLGIDKNNYSEDRNKSIIDECRKQGSKNFAKIIYAAYGDNAEKCYFGDYKFEMPKYQRNTSLDALYTWLCALGYEMSDEEKALMDGSHELYKVE